MTAKKKKPTKNLSPAQERIFKSIMKASDDLRKRPYPAGGVYNFIITTAMIEGVKKIHKCSEEEAIEIIKKTLAGVNTFVQKEIPGLDK